LQEISRNEGGGALWRSAGCCGGLAPSRRCLTSRGCFFNVYGLHVTAVQRNIGFLDRLLLSSSPVNLTCQLRRHEAELEIIQK
jgi:hypothetical protein